MTEKTLVIDTATPVCSVALFADGELLAGEYLRLGRGHAERLIPMIQALPDRGKAGDIRVNVGPGSFTGIRVGISAARALALAWGANCSGYSCLSLVSAMAAKEQASNIAIDVAMQAGHGEFFFQSFDKNRSAAAQIESLPPTDAALKSSAAIIAGSASDALAKLKPGARALEIFPDARQWSLISNEAPLPPDAAYIRSVDAKLPGGQIPGGSA